MHHERVEEVCWNSAEIRRTLAAAGFDSVRAWDATPFFKDRSHQSQRFLLEPHDKDRQIQGC